MGDDYKLLLNIVLPILGAGLGTAIVGTLLSSRFERQIELLKASLQRGSQIHERQMDALLGIHSKLERANAWVQRSVSGLVLKGENKEQIVENMIRDLVSASEQYSNNKLLFSKKLISKLDEFFSKVQSALISLSIASDPMVPQGKEREKFWTEAQEIAYGELPSVLQAIAAEARDVIHLT